MKEKAEKTDFVKLGTYRAEEAETLKEELEKRGIPVKITYPATNIGREAIGGAIFTAYDLMVRICDIQKVKELE